MSPSAAYEVRLTKGAARQLRDLGRAEGDRVKESLTRLAARSKASSGSRGGKSLKQIRGRRDRFYRLRVGELRVVFDLIHEDGVVLVHGVVNRRDLERWLRRR